MNIVKDSEFLPVHIEIQEDNAKITPVKPFKPNKNYSVLVFLNNGTKYKMDFTTANYGDITPNDSIHKAGKAKLGEPVEGYIEKDVADYYFIEVPESGRLEIDTARYDTGNINLTFSILDDVNQEEVLLSSEADQSGYGDSGKLGSSRNITVDVEPGKYYIKITTPYKSANRSYEGSSGKYKLTVNWQLTNYNK